MIQREENIVLTPMPVVHPVPAGFSSVIPILRQTMPAPEMAHTWPSSLPTETWRKPCLAVGTEVSGYNVQQFSTILSFSITVATTK